MKIRLYIITALCIALVAFAAGGGKKHKTDWEKEGLKGKVKSYRILWYHAVMVSGNVAKADNMPYYESYLLFNEKGNETESGDMNREEHTGSKVVNMYNSLGYCTKSIATEYGAKDTLMQTTVNTYNGNGTKTQSDIFPPAGKAPLKVVYKYDKDGNMLNGRYIVKNDTLPAQHTFAYDNRGNVVEEDWYNQMENLQTQTMNMYDAKGNKTSTTEQWFNDTAHKKAICQYDEHGNVIQGDEYNAEGTIIAKGTFKIEYDKVGNRTRQVEYKNGKPVSIVEYKMVYYN